VVRNGQARPRRLTVGSGTVTIRAPRVHDQRVVDGVRPDGTKELIAIKDGYRESTESWLAGRRDLTEWGMRAPALAIGDGALGFWAAVREVWPETRKHRCWVHRIAHVRTSSPLGSSLRPSAPCTT
jgi:transposase-like protein